MKIALLLFGVLPQLALAQAQQSFSFATLSWGDSVTAADSKLRAEGFTSCESLVMLRLKCKANEFCECFFKGPGVTVGRAQFRNEKLGLVVVTAASKASTLDALVRKYGPHLPIAAARTTTQSLLDPDPSSFRNWKNGDEALTFAMTTGVVIYESPATVRRNRELDTPNTSKF